nr:hypothetical protein BaRGS_030892 [Batillaria attramentaria]
MSVNSDSGSDDVKASHLTERGDDDVCRDFLRNVCRRGKRCKYRHPSGEDGGGGSETGGGGGGGGNSDMGTTTKPEPTFCHDFQNTGCHRPTCKFLHCTREEEEHFHQTGQLPQRLQQAPQPSGGGGGMGGGGGGGSGGVNNSDIPVCRDYMKGECKRGAKCKYRHVSNHHHNHNHNHHNHNHNHNDYDCDGIHRSDLHAGPGRPDMRHADIRPHPNELRTNPSHNHSHNHNHNHSYNNFEDGYDKFERFEYGPPGQGHGPCPDGAVKRRRLDIDSYGNYDSRYGPGPGPTVRPVSYQYQVLEEENTALRRRVEELKKQVADLTATNEVLLEQNARLRVAKTSAVSAVQVPVSQTLPPAVSLTSMGQPPPLQGTALGTHLSHTSLTQQIALNSDMATQHALHSAAQRMAREIQQQQQQAAAAAAPPRPQGAPPPTLGAPSLNPTVTMNPPLASLSLPQNNIVAVSLPSLVTPAPLQQVPGGSMAQNLGTPSNPLVSYPIMSQDMRCAVAPSSMAH